MDLDQVKRDGATVLLSFSCGKDSICAWVALRDAGFSVVPFYMAIVPGLAFVERSLAYYENFFGTHILRVLHPSTYRHLDSYTAQPHQRKATIDFLRLPLFDYVDIERGVKRTAGLPESAWTAVGTRYADSPLRRARMPKDGISLGSRKFFPIAAYDKNDLIATLAKAQVKLPIDYQLFGRSFDGIDYRFLAPIKTHFPDDYRRILDWYPCADMDLFRARIARQHGQAKEIGRKRGSTPPRGAGQGCGTATPQPAECPAGDGQH